MKHRLLLALAATIAAPALAQRTDLPPEAAVMRALDRHPTVEAAGATTDAARAEAEMLRKGPHEITLSGSYIRRTVDREGGFDEFDGTVSRAFRLPGKARLDRAAGAFGVKEASNNQEDARHQTSLTLMNLWHDWLRAGALVRTDQAAVDNLEAALKAVRRRVELRDAAALDTDKSEAELALAQSRLAESRSDLEQARAMLAATFPELPLPLAPPTPAIPALPETGLKVLRDLVIQRSHEIRAAEARAEKYDMLGQRARRDRLADPSVGVRAFSERGGAERGLGVVASIPLGGGYRQANADKAQAEARRARLEAMTVRREVQATADADERAADMRFLAWQAAQRSRVSAMAAATRARRGYMLGATDLADLLYIERQALEAQHSEIMSQVEALRAIMKLQVDSHTIWAPADEAGE